MDSVGSRPVADSCEHASQCMLDMFWEWKLHESVLGSCPVTGFRIGDVEPSRSDTTVLIN